MIYVHVPFCGSFCTYCDFYSELVRGGQSKGSGAGGRVKGYVDGVISEINRRREEIAATLQTNTLYIGGGTPSVLPLDGLSRIVKALEAVGARDFDEFTVEVNPEDIVEKGAPYAKGLRRLGVNRVSMGVQSLDDRLLRWMNRRHDSARALEAFRILRRAGFDNISVDVIFGISQQSDEVLEDTLRGLLGIGTDHPEHISAYQLSVEEGSALGRMQRSGLYKEASDEQCAAQYELLCRTLAAAGYHHYEISNWALPGREARHNSAYWTGQPYVGLGPGAHSFSGFVGSPGAVADPGVSVPGVDSNASETARGVVATRSWNSKALSGWTSEAEHLTADDLRIERIMLGLRTDRGIPLSWLSGLNGATTQGTLEPVPDTLPTAVNSSTPGFRSATVAVPGFRSAAVARGVPGNLSGDIIDGAPRVRIPENRWFVSDDIISSLI